MLSSFNRPRPVAWFFFLLAFGGTLALGTWQVKRLQWKEGLIAALAQAQTKPALSGLPKDEAALVALQFHPVTLKGTWVADTEFHLAPRYVKDQFGYALISPLKLADGRIVLINRGWIPAKRKALETRPESRARGAVTLTGLVRVGNERSTFTPPNQPEKNIWFGRDIAQMAEAAKLNNVVPAMVDMADAKAHDKALTMASPPLPIPSDGIIRLRNDHLSYILTWYGIALGVLVIFVVYHRKR